MENQISKFPVSAFQKEDFPKPLSEISRPPKILYCRGTLPDFGKSWIAMVGTRRPSPAAEEICKRLVMNLTGTDAVLVSGLAQGIDSFCHAAAVRFGIPTVAVIAQGIETEIGGSRGKVALDILKSGGAILSEYPGKTAPLKFMFPERNRIIAGLCKSTTIVESKLSGGGTITAEFAKKFHRKLLCIPGSPLAENSQGPNSYIARRDAEAVWDFQNFADFCGAKRTADVNPSEAVKTGIRLSEETFRLYEECSGFSYSLEAICQKANLPPPKVLAILTELEIAGLVHARDGVFFHFSATE